MKITEAEFAHKLSVLETNKAINESRIKKSELEMLSLESFT